MKSKLLLLLFLLIGASGFAQYTSIPDTKFEAKLIALGIDDVADGKVLTSNINTLTELDLSNKSISDLTGIQDFAALTSLNCNRNSLTSLDVSKNTLLLNLNCTDNKLSNLDVSQNIALKSLNFNNNKISSIDLSKNTSLANFQCSYNQLTSLDVSNNTALTILLCRSNKITSLDISKNTVLGWLQCDSNELTTLNIKNGKNTSFTILNFANNKNLSCIAVDDVAYAKEKFSNQAEVYAFFSPFDCSVSTLIPNPLFEDKLIALGIDTDGKNGVVLNSSLAAVTSLDVSNSSLTDLTGLEGFTALTTLNCSGNLLKTIDLSKTTAFTTLDCSNNPELTCIQVADIAFATNNWATTKDANANFSLDCRPYTIIPDPNFEARLIALKHDDVADGKVLTSKINTLTFLATQNSSITDLTGIQDFVKLKTLYCQGNKLTSLDVSKNTQLNILDCSNNNLSNLDVSKNTALITLDCYTNNLSNLDVSKNTSLTKLSCSNNNLSNLNLKNGKNTLFTTLSFSTNYSLSCIAVDDVVYANTNWADKKNTNALFTLYECSTLTQIPDAQFEDKLIALGIDTDGKNQLVLNSSIAALTVLDVSDSSIADLTGIQGFTALTTLNASNNLLKSIDLSQNSSLTTLDCSNNTSLTCIQVADIAAATNNWSITKDATANLSLDCKVYTLIPDTNFEAKLIALKFDDVADGRVLTSKINNLTSLDVGNSSIADLTGIHDFTALTTLRCNSNKLTSLDVSKNTALKSLSCNSNSLTSLDVSKNTALTSLSFSNNKISTIDVSNALSLTGLDCAQNNLKSLDVSKNTALTWLDCWSNDITSLDLSKNPALTRLSCRYNKLTLINLKNGKNTLLTDVSFPYNKDLSCVVVDDVDYAKANWDNQAEVYPLFSPYDCSIVTTIPNALFEDKLIALGIDTDGKNGIVLNSSIETVTTLDVSNSSLTDMKGLEGFTALTTLNASNNLLSSINLSKTTAFTNLDCSNNAELTCIQVADIAYATENWTVKKDALANFSLDCNGYTLIPDANFEKELIESEIDDVADGKVLTSNISKLKTLYISYGRINDFTGIQDFKALTSLTCNGSDATSLDLSKNTALTTLRFNSGKLTSLDLSKNTALTSVDCSRNQITSLNISENTALTSLNCSSNKLTELDVTKNIALSNLNCSANQLKTLDVNINTKLYSLDCKNNRIENLDVSKNIALRTLYANSNKISNLNLKNGKNTELSYLNFSDNPTLSCIAVDDIDYANTNWADKKEAYSYFTIYDCSTTTKIPDPVFEDKLIALGIDTDGKNGHVLNSSIETLTTLDVSNSSITDVRGLEGFKALQTLNVSNNSLSNLDLSKNNAITTLKCSINTSLTCIMVADIAVAKNNWTTTKDSTAEFSLDCRGYTLIPDTNFEAKLIALEIDDTADGKVLTSNINTLNTLDVSNSSITDLTGIQGFTALINLTCSYNQLTSLDVSKNTQLKSVYSINNKLTSLDVSKNTQLETLHVNNNTLTKLDLGEGLINLYCQDNQLTGLDVSKSTLLEYLYCQNNQITALDVSKNTELFIFYCNDNILTSLNLKNGNNTNFFIASFRDNPTLTCIMVDDVAYANANMKSRKDATAIYTTYDCSTVTGIPDPKFEDKLIALGIDTDGKNELVFNSSIQTVTTLDVSNSSITKLTGIQGFTALTNLNCSKNQLITLDVSKNTALTVLACKENQLELLDLTGNTSLTELNVSSNKLTALDISKNVALTNLIADTNKLSALDVSKNISLSKLNVSSNQLTALNINNNTALTHLDFSSNQVTSIDLTKNIALTQLFCNSNQLSSLSIAENIAVTDLNCSLNQLISLNLKNGNNVKFNLATLHFENNPDLSCIKVDDKTYSDANWNAIKDATAAYDNQCGLSLPSDNFTIQTKGESCPGENNGEINITAVMSFAYTANINGQVNTFADNALNLSGLAPGNYAISITIPGENFEQNYNVTIAKGTSITGKSSISSKKVNVEIIEGTAPYTVFVDGVEQFQTTTANFSVAAEQGLLEVKTAKACEGIYKENITGSAVIVSAYPNPTFGNFEINLPATDKEVTIELYSLDGRLISNKKYNAENGTAQLTLENQPNGTYVAKVHAGSVKNLKIIKK